MNVPGAGPKDANLDVWDLEAVQQYVQKMRSLS